VVVGEDLPHALQRVEHAVESIRETQRMIGVRIDRGVVERGHSEHGVHIAEEHHENGHEEQFLGRSRRALHHDPRALEVDDDLRRPDDPQFGEIARNPVEVRTRILSRSQLYGYNPWASIPMGQAGHVPRNIYEGETSMIIPPPQYLEVMSFKMSTQVSTRNYVQIPKESG